jgi:hypothetical protein
LLKKNKKQQQQVRKGERMGLLQSSKRGSLTSKDATAATTKEVGP